MNNFDDKIKEMQISYKNKLKSTISSIIDNIKNDEINGEIIFNSIHKLVGSGATFGFKEISNIAYIGEEKIKKIGNFNKNIEKIKPIALNTLEQLQKIIGINIKEENIMKKTIYVKNFKKNILIIDLNKMIDDSYLNRFELYNYNVSIIRDENKIINNLDSKKDCIFIFDTKIFEKNILNNETLKNINKDNDILYISQRYDIENRFHAVKSFAKTYFAIPFDIEDILDYIEKNINDQNINPNNILIVEDDVDAANFYALILDKAGMNTKVVNSAIDVMNVLEEFNPDLILLDMYMPEYNGIELAAIIRQFKSFVSLPIVFLSAEKNPSIQLSALKYGGDDFLTKPIEPSVLISTVSLKAKRMRELREVMEIDGLTQLLNHVNIKKQLAIEFSKAHRYNKTLSIAMIDIDNFKKINDTYGHLVGDNVLKSLSRLFRKRLRKSDLIGRYGGEEFLMIFAETNKNNVKYVIDNILNDFRKISHFSIKGNFNVSFSCGIVQYTNEKNYQILNDNADKALYEAKKNGKCQSIIF